MPLSEDGLNKIPDKEFKGVTISMVNDFKEDTDKLLNEFKEHMNNLLGEFQENTSKQLNEIRKSVQDVKIEFNQEIGILKEKQMEMIMDMKNSISHIKSLVESSRG